MRVGLYGGSFDPIHRGHLAPIQEVRRHFELDRVIYLPTARPPHKSGRVMAPAWRRYVMVELALLEEEGLYASPFEMALDRPSYTIDSIDHFRAKTPEDDLFLLIGSDSLASLNRWREWRRIVETVEVIAMVRPEYELDQVRSELAPELIEGCESGRIHLMKNRPVEASSTAIRRQIAGGERPAAEVLPPIVLNYLTKYELYREG